MIKSIRTYDIDKINKELNILLETQPWDSAGEKFQFSLQTAHGQKGYMHTYDIDMFKYPESEYIDLTIPSDWELARVIDENGLCRTRLVNLPPLASYPYHVDCGFRVHLAIKTNPSAFFFEDGKLIHIPADGHAYLIDVTKLHSAWNGAFKEDTSLNRIHLVGTVRDIASHR